MDHDSPTSSARSSASTNTEPIADLIPPPLTQPHLGRRQFLKMSAAAVALAALPIRYLVSSSTTQAAPNVDLSSPIGKSWARQPPK